MMTRKWMVAMLLAVLLGGLTACQAPAEPAAESTAAQDQGAEAAAGEMASPEEAYPPAGEPAAAEQSAPGAGGGLLDTVQARGKLICGVNGQLPGFSVLNPDGEYSGFDVDFCRAVAAAVLGDAAAVEFRPLTTQERFTALQTGEIDVLFRNTTWTLSRDSQNGLDFGPTTFYDGQGMMVPKASGVESLADMDGANICVQAGTTTEKNLGDAMRELGAEYTPVVFQDPDQTFGAYDEGRCDGVTSDKSQLVSRQTTLSDPTAHKILEVTMSKEPLGPAVLQGDARWADVINWVVLGIIQADEFRISSANVADFLASENPEIRRFLGAEDALGDGLGLSNDFMVNVIQQVGSYGEIYDRNLGPDTPFNLPRGLNATWIEGGLLYSPPFR